MLLSLFVVIAITPMAPWQCAHACLFLCVIAANNGVYLFFFPRGETKYPAISFHIPTSMYQPFSCCLPAGSGNFELFFIFLSID